MLKAENLKLKSARGLAQSIAVWAVCFACAAGWASNVYVFNPVSYPVTNAGVAYLTSADTLFWQGASNALINPAMPTNAIQFTKMSNGVVRAMTAAEVTSITNFLATNATAQARAGGVMVYDDDGAQARVLKAIVELIVDQLNAVRTNPAASLPAISYGAARTAITNKLAND